MEEQIVWNSGILKQNVQKKFETEKTKIWRKFNLQQGEAKTLGVLVVESSA